MPTLPPELAAFSYLLDAQPAPACPWDDRSGDAGRLSLLSLRAHG
jgi:hypothetical protein